VACFLYFWYMYKAILLVFLLTTTSFFAQHKVYLTFGGKIEGKVTEVGVERIILIRDSVPDFIAIRNIILIDYGKGKADVFGEAIKDIYLPGSSSNTKGMKSTTKITRQNEIYLNSLSLVNADLAVFYEHQIKGRKLGLGLMGAFNFNAYANFANIFIAVLSNGKKLYDVGIFSNVYLNSEESSIRWFMGLMLKYTEFSYSYVKEDSTYVNNSVAVQISYTPARGNQLSTLLSVGAHKQFNEGFFMKFSASIGAFRLKGDYKQQFNYVMNSGNSPTSDKVNYSLLPKAYLSISTGWKF
jgi:hypothetical protein